jgi:hypothetical protein
MSTLALFVLALYLVPVFGLFRVCKSIHDWIMGHKRLEADLQWFHIGGVHLGGLFIGVALAAVSLVTIFTPYLAANSFPVMLKVGYVLDVLYTGVTIWTAVNWYSKNFGKKTPDGK